jgi:hypothetical protein
MLHAVASVFQVAGSKVSPPAQDSAAAACVSLLEDPKSDVRSAAALALAAIANWLGVAPPSSDDAAAGAAEGARGAAAAAQGGEVACPEPLQALVTATLLPNLTNKSSSSSSDAWLKRAGAAEALGAVVAACGAKVGLSRNDDGVSLKMCY